MVCSSRTGLAAAFALALAPTWASAAPQEKRARYDGQKLVQVQVDSREELQIVLDLAHDVWTERPGTGTVDIVVDEGGEAALGVTGLPYTVVNPDLQAMVDAEYQRLHAPSPQPAPPGAFFDDFRPLPEVLEFLKLLADDHPELIKPFDLGPSLEGRPIMGLRIGAQKNNPAVLLNGCQHAREWITVMTTACIAHQLATEYDTDPEIQSLLDSVTFYVIPVVNPDGYEYSWTTKRFWRKNRRNDHGVDLNRNWAVAWGGDGSSADPESGNYRGTAPFSEPETDAMGLFIESRDEIVSHIDFHSYSQFILYPWGFDYVVAPADATLGKMAGVLSETIFGVHGMFYDPIQAADFYPAAGNMPDYTYGAHGIYGYTIELRPAEAPDDFVSGFVLPPEQIVPTCEENLAAVLELARWSATVRPGLPGDDGGVTSTSSSSSGGGLDFGWPGTSTGPSPTTSGPSGGDTGDPLPPTSGTVTTSDPDTDAGADSGSGTGQDLAGRGCACALGSPAPARDAVWLGLLALMGFSRRRG